MDTTSHPPGRSGSDAACPPLQFFGVRGSGEHSGYGPTIGSLEQDMARKVHGMGAAAIDYPAVDVPLPTASEISLASRGTAGEVAAAAEYARTLATYRNAYKNSVTAGLAGLLADYNGYERKCPGHAVMFAGYSQGADVATQAYEALPSAKKSRVILVNFGDPHFDSAEHRVEHGGYSSDLPAILVHWWGEPVHPFTQADSSHVGSWCAARDVVCNWSWPNLVLGGPLIHLTVYPAKYTAPAAAWAYPAWQTLSR